MYDLINKKKKVYLKVGLFLLASLRLARPTRAASSQGCRGCIYLSVRVRRHWEKQGSRRWRSETTTDSLHRFLPNVRFTELRSREGKSTVRIDRKPRLVVGGKLGYTVTRCEAPMLLYYILVE